VGTVLSPSLAISSNTAAPANTLIANYTLSVTDGNNACVSKTIIPIFQSLSTPNATIAGNAVIDCNTNSLVLTINASSNVPPDLRRGQNVVAYLWNGPPPQDDLQLSTSYVAYIPGTYSLTVRDNNNGCMKMATKFIADNRLYPYVNRPSAPKPFILDCGEQSVEIQPAMGLTASTLSYSWIAAPEAKISYNPSSPKLITDKTGQYFVIVTDNSNGCVSEGVVEVVDGTLTAGFDVSSERGFAPFTVTFTNTSHSSTDSLQVYTYWHFGNNTKFESDDTRDKPSALYNAAGDYTVMLHATRGNCLAAYSKVITVELPSALEIPNIFTPNNDGVNDVYFIKGTNLTEIKLTVFDRWGHLVFDLVSSKGNVAWDGKNQYGAEVAAGIYYYTLNATGSDGKDFKLKGNITLVR
jgi:gliding motility-associated-like protein